MIVLHCKKMFFQYNVQNILSLQSVAYLILKEKEFQSTDPLFGFLIQMIGLHYKKMFSQYDVQNIYTHCNQLNVNSTHQEFTGCRKSKLFRKSLIISMFTIKYRNKVI